MNRGCKYCKWYHDSWGETCKHTSNTTIRYDGSKEYIQIPFFLNKKLDCKNFEEKISIFTKLKEFFYK